MLASSRNFIICLEKKKKTKKAAINKKISTQVNFLNQISKKEKKRSMSVRTARKTKVQSAHMKHWRRLITLAMCNFYPLILINAVVIKFQDFYSNSETAFEKCQQSIKVFHILSTNEQGWIHVRYFP